MTLWGSLGKCVDSMYNTMILYDDIVCIIPIVYIPDRSVQIDGGVSHLSSISTICQPMPSATHLVPGPDSPYCPTEVVSQGSPGHRHDHQTDWHCSGTGRQRTEDNILSINDQLWKNVCVIKNSCFLPSNEFIQHPLRKCHTEAMDCGSKYTFVTVLNEPSR